MTQTLEVINAEKMLEVVSPLELPAELTTDYSGATTEELYDAFSTEVDRLVGEKAISLDRSRPRWDKAAKYSLQGTVNPDAEDRVNIEITRLSLGPEYSFYEYDRRQDGPSHELVITRPFYETDEEKPQSHQYSFRSTRGGYAWSREKGIAYTLGTEELKTGKKHERKAGWAFHNANPDVEDYYEETGKRLRSPRVYGLGVEILKVIKPEMLKPAPESA